MTVTSTRIQLAKPSLGEPEETAVLEVLRSGMLVQGKTVARFEAGLCAATGRTEAIAVANGTSALELALRALGVQPGDHVLCPDLTWPSPAHAILTLGAQPVFVDVAIDTWNVGPDAMARARTDRTTAAIVIDQFGNPAPVPDIAAALPGLPIVVDAACSLGSELLGRPAGSFGDVACMSFHPRKVITTGEGGVCLTDRQDLAERLRQLRNHGQRAPGQFAIPSGNYRLDELAAALGCAQLARLPKILVERRALAARYRQAMHKSLTMQAALPTALPNHQTLGLLLPAGLSDDARDAFVSRLREQGVESGRLSFALHTLPHLSAAAPQTSCPNAVAIADRGIALPLFAGMATVDQERVLQALDTVLTWATP